MPRNTLQELTQFAYRSRNFPDFLSLLPLGNHSWRRWAHGHIVEEIVSWKERRSVLNLMKSSHSAPFSTTYPGNYQLYPLELRTFKTVLYVSQECTSSHLLPLLQKDSINYSCIDRSGLRIVSLAGYIYLFHFIHWFSSVASVQGEIWFRMEQVFF